MDASILKPSKPLTAEPTLQKVELAEYLRKDAYLAEYAGKAGPIRHNLNVYSKDQVYTKDEVEQLIMTIVTDVIGKHLDDTQAHSVTSKIRNALTGYLRADGKTPLTGNIKGVDPRKPEDMATKAYVDALIRRQMLDNKETLLKILLLTDEVKNEVGITDQFITRDDVITLIRKKLDSRPVMVLKVENIDLKPIHTKIDKLSAALTRYIDEQIRSLDLGTIIRSNGSVGFSRPLKGKNATANEDLVPMRQVREMIADAIDKAYIDTMTLVRKMVDEAAFGEAPLEEKLPIVIEIPTDENLHIVCDDYVYAPNTTLVTLCMTDLGVRLEEGQLYQNGTLLYSFSKKDFYDGSIQVQSAEVLEDTVFVFRVRYNDGTKGLVRKDVQCSLPVFVGLLPKGRMGNNISMLYLKDLAAKDKKAMVNRFIDMDKNEQKLEVVYHQKNLSVARPFIVMSTVYPNLKMIIAGSEAYGKEAIDCFESVPMKVDGIDADLLYKVYVCHFALPKIELKVIFQFGN